MVRITKSWETVTFTASKGDIEEAVELNMNHENKNYTLCNGNDESVSFENKDPFELKLLMQALKAAQKYITENFYKDSK